MEPQDYKTALSEEIEKRFQSIIQRLRRNGYDIDGIALLKDWRQVKAKYLAFT